MGHDQPAPSTSRLPLSSTAAVFAFLRDTPDAPTPDPQPDPATLAAFSVKVRDFAYESTLPPIAPFRRRQIQPGPGVRRPLKRTRVLDGARSDSDPDDDDYNDADDPFAPRRPLQRAPTEPSVGAGGGGGSGTRVPLKRARERERGFVDLRAAAAGLLEGVHDSQSQSQSQSQCQSQSQSQLQSQPQSQESDEAYIATPFVTPNGSLQWIDVQGPPPQPPPAPPPAPLARTISSPLSSASSSSARLVRSPSPPPPRYQLRKRPGAASAPGSPTKTPYAAGAKAPYAKGARGSPYARSGKRPPARREESLSVVIQS
ncbi:hypothetical protein B0H10DRAFT_1989910 [Mycena sp. CBHHK59/15]|nr:hypothetical protein B0H10DRAFT_1989910 [Mycena sp. CBHHK59/15]